jgi:hypothetical protein
VLRVLKAESNLSETTNRAAALLEELRSRLNPDSGHRSETSDELDRELQAYFSGSNFSGSNPSQKGALDEIRDRVIEGVVDRIMRAWQNPQAPRLGALEEAVVAKLIERVLEGLATGLTERALTLR